jgi:hypothetical protein
MTLLIAVLLIYQFSMPAWLHAAAVIVWLVERWFSLRIGASISHDIKAMTSRSR